MYQPGSHLLQDSDQGKRRRAERSLISFSAAARCLTERYMTEGTGNKKDGRKDARYPIVTERIMRRIRSAPAITPVLFKSRNR
ncbi:hypothetical protein ACFLXE_08160 [Chloroflexota bacterium]